LLISALCWTHLFFQWLKTPELRWQNRQLSFTQIEKSKQHYFSPFSVLTGGCKARKARVVSLGAGTLHTHAGWDEGCGPSRSTAGSTSTAGNGLQQSKTLGTKMGVSVK